MAGACRGVRCEAAFSSTFSATPHLLFAPHLNFPSVTPNPKRHTQKSKIRCGAKNICSLCAPHLFGNPLRAPEQTYLTGTETYFIDNSGLTNHIKDMPTNTYNYIRDYSARLTLITISETIIADIRWKLFQAAKTDLQALKMFQRLWWRRHDKRW